MSNKYEVTIKMVVLKTYTVEANTEDEARDIVFEMATAMPELGVPEDYDEDIISIEKVG